MPYSRLLAQLLHNLVSDVEFTKCLPAFTRINSSQNELKCIYNLRIELTRQ